MCPTAGTSTTWDAQTGALVNLTELEAKLGDMGMGGGNSSEDSAAGTPENSLSQAEQEGIQKLEGVMSKETLDGQLRAVAQYGLEDYTLSSASYRLIEATETQEEQVLCTLRYLLPGTDETASRTFTVDAKTGQVEDLWSYLPWDEDQKPSLTPGGGPDAGGDLPPELLPRPLRQTGPVSGAPGRGPKHLLLHLRPAGERVLLPGALLRGGGLGGGRLHLRALLLL